MNMPPIRAVAAIFLGSLLPLSAASSFLGYLDSDFNESANWTNGLPDNTNGAGTIEVPSTMTADYIMSNNGSPSVIDIIVNSTLNTGAFELQSRSGGVTRTPDIVVGSGAGNAGTLNVQNGGRLDIAGAAADVFIGRNGGTGALTFETGGICQIGKALEILDGIVTFQAGAVSGGNTADELVVDDAGTLVYEIDGAFSHYTLVGNSLGVELGATSTLKLDFAAAPTLGDTYDLITGVSGFGGAAGVFGHVEVSGIPATLAVQINYAAPLLQAEIISNPNTDPQLGGRPSFAFTNNGAPETLTVPIQNVGPTATLNISGVTPSGTDLAAVSAIANPATLAAGVSGDITFTFTPSGSGSYSFELNVASDDPATPGVIPISVEVGDPLISAPLAAHDFGSFTPNPGAQTTNISVTNEGGATDLTIDAINTIIVGSPEFTVTSIPAPIAPGASGDIEVTFDPGGSTGEYVGYLEIASDDFHGRLPKVGVKATVANTSPQLEVDPSFVFLNDGAADAYEIPVENVAGDGTTVLNISAVSASGTDAGTVSGISFSPTVDFGFPDTVDFTFTPSGPGFYSFNIEISSDDLSQVSPRLIAISMEVQDPVIALSGNAIDFGTFSASPGAQMEIVTIFNDGGNADLIIDAVGTVITGDTEFTINTTLPITIPAGDFADLEVTFDPGSGFGVFSGTLDIVSDDYFGTTPQVALSAMVLPPVGGVQLDFGTAGSPVQAGFTQLISGEGATKTLKGVTVTMTSRDADIVAATGGNGSIGLDDLTTDTAQTTFNGGNGNYISLTITGLQTGTLDLMSFHNYATSGFTIPFDVFFGEQGGSLTQIANDAERLDAVDYSVAVDTGKTYELQIVDQANADVAYISGLILTGDAVPQGTAYDSFVTDAGLDPNTDGAPDLDPDGDTVETGVEWVVGGSPNDLVNGDTDKLPSGTSVTGDPDGDMIASDYLLFTYRRTDESDSDSNTTIAVVYGEDLQAWNTAANGVDGVVIIETIDGFDTNVDQVDVYIPAALAAGGKLFARLNVTISTP